MQASSLQAASLPATPQRVTLSDFQRLQQALLETRQALYDSQERESSATVALEQLRCAPPVATAFPPPPPRQKKAEPAAAASPDGGVYPVELNPFGSRPGANGCGAGGGGGGSSSSGGGSSGGGSSHAAAAACFALRRRGLLRLVFHAWRASHSQTCILRNMSSMATLLQARRGADGLLDAPAAVPVLPVALSRLIGDRDCDDAVPTDGEAQLRSEADAAALRAEVGGLEADLARERARAAGLSLRCRAGAAALQEVALTAAALHGRALCALDDEAAHERQEA